MSPSECNNALLAALSEAFSAPLAQVFIMVTLQRLAIDPTQLSVAQLPQVVRVLAESLPSYLSDPQRREQCLARLVALAPEAAEPSRVAPLPESPSGTPPSLRSRRPPKPGSDPPRTKSLRVESAEDVVAACDAVREVARRIGFPQLVE